MEQPQLDRLDFSKVSILQILPKEIVMHIICFFASHQGGTNLQRIQNNEGVGRGRPCVEKNLG